MIMRQDHYVGQSHARLPRRAVRLLTLSIKSADAGDLLALTSTSSTALTKFGKRVCKWGNSNQWISDRAFCRSKMYGCRAMPAELTSTLVDRENAGFWQELCGTHFAKSIGVVDDSALSLKKFDDWYFAFYPDLFVHLEACLPRSNCYA
jgi:hypothetical protein